MWRSIAMLCALCLSCRCVLLSVGIVAAPGVVCLNRASSRGRARVVCCCDTAGARRTSTLPHLPQPGRLRGGRGKGLLALLALFRALFGLFWMPFGGLPSQGEPRWVGGGVRCSVKQAGFFSVHVSPHRRFGTYWYPSTTSHMEVTAALLRKGLKHQVV